MDKLIRNGEVAVLISSGYGAGWYSWNTGLPQLLFHPKIVEKVELGEQADITEDWLKAEGIIKEDDYVYCGGAEGLYIHWLPVGTPFEVDEYDGAEILRTVADLVLIA